MCGKFNFMTLIHGAIGTPENGADARPRAESLQNFWGGGGGRLTHSVAQLFSTAVFVGLLLLLPSPAQSQNKACGEPTTLTSGDWRAPEVTCDTSLKHSLSAAEVNALDEMDHAVVGYQVTSGTDGLKVTLNEGINIDGSPPISMSSVPFLKTGVGVWAENNASKGIWIVSRSNIFANLHAILAKVEDADVPVRIDVLGGTIRSAQATGAIKYQGSESKGDVTINFAGYINARGGIVGNYSQPQLARGIDIYRSAALGGDITIALKKGGKIDGKISEGVYIHDEYAPAPTEDGEDKGDSQIRVTTEMGSSIGTASGPVNSHGMFIWVQYNRATAAQKDVTITHGGEIYSKAEVIKVVSANSNGGKGTATVTIEKDGVVQAINPANRGKFGIFLETPDRITAGDTSTRRKQSVTVHGKVLGEQNGGAFYLKWGGTIHLGPDAVLRPAVIGNDYRTVVVDTPDGNANFRNLRIEIDRNWRDIVNISNGGTNGKTKTEIVYRNEEGGEWMTLADGTVVDTKVLEQKVPCGFYNDCQMTETITAKLTPYSRNYFSVLFSGSLSEERTVPAGVREPSKRGRTYEVLPSVLWDLTGSIDTYQPEISADGGAAGATQVAQSGTMAVMDDGGSVDYRGWGRFDGSSSERRLDKSLAADLSYQLSHRGFAAGVDVSADNGWVYRVGLHRRQSKARVTDGGQVEALGTGGGVGIARALGAGLSVHGWLGGTQFDDIEIMSTEMVGGNSIEIDQKTKGTSYTVGLGLAQRRTFGGLALTQRGDLMWSSVSMKDFKASYTAAVTSSISSTGAQQNTPPEPMNVVDTVVMKKDSGLTGRYGVMLEGEYKDASGACCRLFGSLDLEHDFHAKRQVTISSTGVSVADIARSEVKPTSMRLGFGGSKSWNGGESAISGAVYHTTAGGGNSMLSGNIAVSFRF